MNDHCITAIRRDLLNRLKKFQHSTTPKCQWCGEQGHLELHHILRRGSIGKKELGYAMPIEFFAFLCTECNHNPYMDTPDGRAELMAKSAAMHGGLIAYEIAFDKWAETTRLGQNLVSLSRIKEIINEQA